VGVGAPLGFVGAYFEWNLSRLVGLTAGAGFGGTFGPALALGTYIRPAQWGRWAPVLGGGYSVNFTPGGYVRDPQITGPTVSNWLNGEAGIEYRSPRGVLFRTMVGYTMLLNTGDFTNHDFDGHYGPASGPSIGNNPVSAADAHDRGQVLHFPFVHIDLG